jgi:hypothetical protein
MINSLLLIVMTVFNVFSIIGRLANKSPLEDIIFWGALFLWGICLGLWAEKNLS